MEIILELPKDDSIFLTSFTLAKRFEIFSTRLQGTFCVHYVSYIEVTKFYKSVRRISKEVREGTKYMQ